MFSFALDSILYESFNIPGSGPLPGIALNMKCIYKGSGAPGEQLHLQVISEPVEEGGNVNLLFEYKFLTMGTDSY